MRTKWTCIFEDKDGKGYHDVRWFYGLNDFEVYRTKREAEGYNFLGFFENTNGLLAHD